MSHFIFKGIHSSDRGIIVENLPAIVKPPKKYNVKEIDGSNHSIVEDLGYKAYERIIQIGFKHVDMDMVYDWLDGSGQLILSNEPDKYYDAYILNQIDYEKAIRFRKASLTFLVQPYKHAFDEEGTTSRVVINIGNTDCLPLMTITGNGQINVNINGIKACTLTNVTGNITLDGEAQEAYKGTIATLQNRIMIGDFPKLAPGENSITFTGSGTVTQVNTIVRSRWL
jgi:predicted phage tail component-like protein